MTNTASPIETLTERLAPPRSAPPVESWTPPFCGDIDMRICRDGSWRYLGSPIQRPALVRLFSSILRKDPERFVLVTPAECVGIIVEDAPFLAVELLVEGGGPQKILRFRTNVDEWVSADAEHPLRFETAEADGVKPYVLVRGGLWALVKRSVAIDLIALAEVQDRNDGRFFGVSSAGQFFPISPAPISPAGEIESSN
ncbi:DUF1285 domain-containing protein [Methylocapsa palsarum]|uniref:DUF1285 domain-containing protein n=1 Tax=Methylocapsa palsarum TaxID=1612308 RepID=A0A1I3WUT4_9HYPH|nr:DUF1285 domain-containing protein [Methylocapsa palsarum]SFK11268.1 hypothetical protein SAMN05444581_102164 [Methylocapsa palsarum]